jgi:membrane protease YdiL (CAAX protease family)
MIWTWYLLTLLLAGCIFVWCCALWRVREGRPLLTVESRAVAAWGLVDLLLLFFVTVLLAAPLAMLFNLWLPAQYAEIAGFTAATLLAVAVSSMAIAWRSLRPATSWWHLEVIARDIRIAGIVFLAVAAPVYVVQAILTAWFPYEHPLLEMVERDRSVLAFLTLALAVVIVAPIVEEFVFRKLLQGWLENVGDGRLDALYLILGNGPWNAPRLSSTEPPSAAGDGEAVDRGRFEDAGEYPFRQPSVQRESGSAEEVHAEQLGTVPQRLRPVPIWPIFVSSLVFAGLHYGHGPAPVPLFLFGLALGYLYRCTHRLLPCVLVHMLFNGCSMLMLLIQLAFG